MSGKEIGSTSKPGIEGGPTYTVSLVENKVHSECLVGKELQPGCLIEN
jgi:hypothetical protein